MHGLVVPLAPNSGDCCISGWEHVCSWFVLTAALLRLSQATARQAKAFRNKGSMLPQDMSHFTRSRPQSNTVSRPATRCAPKHRLPVCANALRKQLLTPPVLGGPSTLPRTNHLRRSGVGQSHFAGASYVMWQMSQTRCKISHHSTRNGLCTTCANHSPADPTNCTLSHASRQACW